MAFTRVAALLHAALSDVVATQHHTATVAADLNLADLAERDHASLTSLSEDDHHLTATIVQMQAETVPVNWVNPLRVRHSPGVAKARCVILEAGTLQAGSYNTASITDVAAGSRVWVFDDDFANTEYTVSDSFRESAAGHFANWNTHAVGSIGLITEIADGTDTDFSTMQTADGLQV